jgi:hypothetical protein
MRSGIGGLAGPITPVVIILEPEGYAVFLDLKNWRIKG